MGRPRCKKKKERNPAKRVRQRPTVQMISAQRSVNTYIPKEIGKKNP